MNKWFYRFIMCVLVCIIAYSGFQIFSYYKDVYDNNQAINSIEKIYFKEENNSQSTNGNLDGLKKINEDAVGWITVQNTNINYPIVQGTDNDYYLHRTFERKSSSVGSIFMDYRNKIDEPLQNIIIYGHNRKDGSMFHNLRNYLKDPSNEAIRKVSLSLNNSNYEGEVVAAYEANKNDEYYTPSFSTKEEYQAYLETIFKRSVLKGEPSLSEGDLLVTLSTCSYNNDDNRFVAHVLLKKQD